MDIAMPELNGLEVVARVTRGHAAGARDHAVDAPERTICPPGAARRRR